MTTFLNEWLKQARLEIDPNSQNASKYFKHWLMYTFREPIMGTVFFIYETTPPLGNKRKRLIKMFANSPYRSFLLRIKHPLATQYTLKINLSTKMLNKNFKLRMLPSMLLLIEQHNLNTRN